MILLDSNAFDFENRITTGQILEIISMLCAAGTFLMRKYVRSEEESEKLKSQEKKVLDMQDVQTRLTGVQANQQTLIEQMSIRMTRVEDWRERFFNVGSPSKSDR